jgi:hypothetical protein
MDDSAPSAKAQPARPRVAFLAVPIAEYPIRPLRVEAGAYVVAVDTTVPGFDHAASAEIMRIIIGDFEDVTVPGAFDRTGPTITSVQHDRPGLHAFSEVSVAEYTGGRL